MATAISSRPQVPHQKPKRPAPPNVQTSQSGNEQGVSSSPSTSSKRPPLGSAHQSTGGSAQGINGTLTGAQRLNNRRRDSQKQGDGQIKGTKTGSADGPQLEKRIKRHPEPYVKTTRHILKKYSKSPPSFILHLHPTHFRFDEQDGSFSYTSPMRILLEHVKAQTVPHEMLEELVALGIKFYDNCLIVQIQDHKNSPAISQITTASSDKDHNQPFSIHNYNKFITPSPFVAYPQSRPLETNDESSAPKPPTGEDAAVKGKRSINNSGSSPPAPQGPRTFTTVLFPTQFCLQEELARFANTIDTRSSGRRQAQTNKGAGSANVPATPSSAGLPNSGNTQSNKRQKMMYNARDVSEIESKIVAATAPPLFLDPVKDLEEAHALLEKLQDPLLSLEPAAPASRKRTVAELAADEALAAEEQRFMLIMDERLVPNAAASSANKTAAAGAEAGNATFEARFERFKAIDEIKINIQQKELEQRQSAQAAQQKAKAEQIERQEREREVARQQAAQEAAKAREIARRQEQMQMQARQMHNQNQSIMQAQQAQQAQQATTQASNQHAHPQTSAATMHNAQQLAVSQPAHSSPIARNLTPQNASSPHAGSGVMGQIGQSVPMTTSTSNQGAGSPARPGSALQHHPIPTTAQRPQQVSSRNGTPAMPNNTPRLQQGTPVMRNVTPTPRMGHASPANQAVGTPNMNHFPHVNGQQLTHQQQQMLLQRQQALHNQQMQQQQQQQQQQPGHMNGQMGGQNMQQLAAQQFTAHQAQRVGPEATYRQSLQNIQQQQMGNQIGHQRAGNGIPMQGGQMPQNMQQQGGNMQQQAPGNKWRNLFVNAQQQFFRSFVEQAHQAYGPQLTPMVQTQIRQQSDQKARQWVARQQQEAQRRSQMMAAHLQQQQQQQNGGSMGPMGGGMGV